MTATFPFSRWVRSIFSIVIWFLPRLLS
jgi:hypothetical protein